MSGQRGPYRMVLVVILFLLSGCGREEGGGGTPVSLTFYVPSDRGSYRAMTETVPDTIRSMTVEISGSDMDTIVDTFDVSPGGSVTREYHVPSGHARRFIASAYSGTSGTGDLLYQGSTVVDLVSGVATTVTIEMQAVTTSSTSPYWVKVYGLGNYGGRAQYVTEMSDGGYIVAGSYYAVGISDIWVMRLAGDGTPQWQKTYGGTGMNIASAVYETTDGGYIVGGFTDSSGAGGVDMLLLKIDDTGNVVWQKTYGSGVNDYGWSLFHTLDGGYVIAGTSGDSSFTDILIVRTRSDGTVVWQKVYDFAALDSAYSIEETSDGGFIVAGASTVLTGNTRSCIFKLNSDGTIAWQKIYDFSAPTGTEYALSAHETRDGGYIVAGYGYDPNTGRTYGWVMKMDSNGNTLWQKTYADPTLSAFFYVIRETGDGGYIVGGYMESYGYQLLMKLRGDGTVDWAKYSKYSSGYGNITDVKGSSNGGYIGAGTTDIGDTHIPAFMVFSLSSTGDTGGGSCWFEGTWTPDVTDVSVTPQDTTITPVDADIMESQSALSSTDTQGAPLTLCGGSGLSLTSWIRTYEREPDYDSVAYEVHETQGGGYVAVGSRGAGLGSDGWILDLDSNGIPVWQKTYGNTWGDSLYSVQQTMDGGYIALGATQLPGVGSYDLWIVKLGGDGSAEWQRTYGDSNGDDWGDRMIRQTSDGGYIVAGRYNTSGSDNGWIIKLDAGGNVDWSIYASGGGNDIINAIEETSDGGYIAVGSTSSAGQGLDDIWLVKLAGDGTVQWQRTYGESVYGEDGIAVHETMDGGYVVLGYDGNLGGIVLKLSSDGTVVWQRSYSNMDTTTGYLYETTDGGYIVAGRDLSISPWKGVLLRLDGSGNVDWARSYSMPNTAYGEGINYVHQTSDGGYVTAGFADPAGNDMQDFWVMKLTSTGEAGTTCTIINTLTPTVQTSTLQVNTVNVPFTPVTPTVTDVSTTITTTDTTEDQALQCGE